MNHKLKIVLVGKHRAQGTGTLVNNYKITGSAEAVAQYIKDKEAELGKCPMVTELDASTGEYKETGIPRFVTPAGRFANKQGTIVRNASGSWRVENDMVDGLNALIKSNAGNPAVANVLAQRLADELIAGMKGTNTSSATVASEEVSADADEKL